MDTLLRLWARVEPVWSEASSWLGLGGLYFFIGVAVVIVNWAGAYQQAFFWKHRDRSLDDAAKYLLFAGYPFFASIGVGLVLVWFGPAWLGFDEPDQWFLLFQAIATAAIWVGAQVYWWGWVVEHIRKPPE